MPQLGNGGMIELIIRDASGQKLESWKFNLSDRKRVIRTISYIKHKYGLFENSSKSWVEE